MDKVECIVVGGGLAGLATAYGLADAGLEVMVLERGDYSGAKNVTGGRLYVQPLQGIYPELWSEAPFERPVARELISLVGDGDSTTIEVASNRFVERPHSYTVIRAKLDQWLAQRVSEKGAMVLPKMKVDSLLCEPSEDRPRVTGIRAGDDEIAADVVVVAEGVLGLLASGAGLRPKPEPGHLAVGYKETLELPPDVIEDRWRLNPGDGAAHLFVGAVTGGIPGGGFIYTNRESISLGLVVGMAHLRAPSSTTQAPELLTRFKELPQVRPMVAGGNLVEYSAHAICEGGIAQVPQLQGDGYVLVGDAAGLSLNALFTVRGMDLAIASGYHAAQAVIEAKRAHDFTAAGLGSYERRLRQSFVLRDLKTYRSVPKLMQNQRLYARYPPAIANFLAELYTVGPEPAERISPRISRAVRRSLLSVSVLRDAMSLRKAS